MPVCTALAEQRWPQSPPTVQFMCPCHGSQYDAQGKKVRGPAPTSLVLAHTDVNDNDVVTLSPWQVGCCTGLCGAASRCAACTMADLEARLTCTHMPAARVQD